MGRGAGIAMETAETKLDRAKILREGKIEIPVTHSGMRQRLPFVVVREKLGDGQVPYLKVERWVDAGQLLKVAAEADLPVMAPSGKYFPPRKKASDYLGL
ncbi:Uncharacterised protein [uncultured archaeon]|nr:Uncharacterised protein [uncultured archaeon]